MSTLSPVIARPIVMAALRRREDAQILQAVPASAFPLELQELWLVAIKHPADRLSRFFRIRDALPPELHRLAQKLFTERADELSILAQADARTMPEFPTVRPVGLSSSIFSHIPPSRGAAVLSHLPAAKGVDWESLV